MKLFASLRILPFAVAAVFAASAFASSRDSDYLDHYEFEASLHAPYRADTHHARDRRGR